MPWQRFAAVFALVFCAFGQAQPEIKLPTTYAAAQLRSWLVAFNSGSHQKFRDFRLANYDKSDATTADLDADVAQRTFERGGIYDLRSIEHSSENEIVVLVQSRRNGWWSRVRVEVSPDYPHKIVFLRAITSSRGGGPGLSLQSVR